MSYYVVCRVCGHQSVARTQPKFCDQPGCDAGWFDLPMFADSDDAERCAEQVTAEETAAA